MITFPRRPVPLNSLRSVWKNRKVDNLYTELYHPGYGKELVDIEKVKTFFGLYCESIINRNISKLKNYMEPQYFNELSIYLQKTATNLDITQIAPDMDGLKEIDVELM